MQLSSILSVLALAAIGTASVAVPRGGRPCDFPSSAACPPEWPTCIRFPSSCTKNCAGLCV